MKAAIGIVVLVVAIGYFTRRKIDPNRGPGLERNLDLNMEEARLVAPPPPTPTDPATCLSLVSYKGAVDDRSTFISGSVKNACDRRYRYVGITFRLFDEAGSVIGTALANQGGLDVGETWKFKAHVVVSTPRFRFDRIVAF